jgi:hypothetical protein
MRRAVVVCDHEAGYATENSIPHNHTRVLGRMPDFLVQHSISEDPSVIEFVGWHSSTRHVV